MATLLFVAWFFVNALAGYPCACGTPITPSLSSIAVLAVLETLA